MRKNFFEKYMLIVAFKGDESKPCFLQFLFEMNTKILLRNLPVTKAVTQFLQFIDLDITNSSSSFQTTKTMSTGFLDSHNLFITVKGLFRDPRFQKGRRAKGKNESADK